MKGSQGINIFFPDTTLRFKVVYLVLYMFKSINIKEKTSNTKTVSYNMGSSPFGLQCHWGSCDC